ncbi:hypothetical protein ANN_14474, partial [Periplaneta americana]
MADRRHRPDTCRQALLSLVREAGFSATETGRRLGVHDSTARRWVRLYREGIEHRLPDSGRKRRSTPAQDAALVAEVEANPHQSASSIKINARFPGSSRTVIRRLRLISIGIRSECPRKCVVGGEENCERDHKLQCHVDQPQKDALWNIIEDAWDRVSSRRQYLRRLIASIPRRMQAVIDAEDYIP